MSTTLKSSDIIKAIASELCEQNPSFHVDWQTVKHDYCYLFDIGNEHREGAIILRLKDNILNVSSRTIAKDFDLQDPECFNNVVTLINKRWG